LNKDYQILIIFGTTFLTQLAIKRRFKFPPHPTCASALPGENGTHATGVEMNKYLQQ